MKKSCFSGQLPYGGKKEGLGITPHVNVLLLITLAVALVLATVFSAIYCYPDLLSSLEHRKLSHRSPPPDRGSPSSKSPEGQTSKSSEHGFGSPVAPPTRKNGETAQVLKLPAADSYDHLDGAGKGSSCDVFRGEWVPDPDAPYYTNDTCWAIYEHLNCMKQGRPDSEFMKWRWQPDGCDLPLFDPAVFLELVRNESLAFVGDSVAWNQMQSLICLVSRVTYPVEVPVGKDDKFRRWFYSAYNFTLAFYWSPYLVRTVKEADGNDSPSTALFNLYLDEADAKWTAGISFFDYVVLSAGHWFLRSTMYYESGTLTGCYHCFLPNVTNLTLSYGYRRAFQTAYRALNELPGYRGITFLRTFAPSHYEHGNWDDGGHCVSTSPLRRNEAKLEGLNLEMYKTQLEEFWAAAAAAEAQGRKYRLLDLTEAMLMRPDGHPGEYSWWPGGRKSPNLNDCVHWCLPGPIDNWGDFLLHMLKTEAERRPSAAGPGSAAAAAAYNIY